MALGKAPIIGGEGNGLQEAVDGNSYAPGTHIDFLDEDGDYKILRVNGVIGGPEVTIADFTDFTDVKSKGTIITDPTNEDDYRLSFGIEKVGIDILKSDGSINIELTGGYITYFDKLTNTRQRINYPQANPVTVEKFAWDGTSLGNQNTWDFISVDDGLGNITVENDNTRYTAPWLFLRENAGAIEFAELVSVDNYSNQNTAQRQETALPNQFPAFLNGWKLVGKMLARTSENNLNRDRVYRMNSLRNENKLVAVGITSESAPELTQAQVESTTGADYTTFGQVNTERLDQWGVSRRVQRIFNTNANFDYTSLGYVDRTAVYVRNTNSASGIGYTYRTDNTVSLQLIRADGTNQSDVVGQNDFNVQPGEIVFAEKDGNVFRASIIPGERVKNFNNAAAANAFGPVPHDSIVTTRNGLIGWRKTGLNNVSFPADGQSNDDWFIIKSDVVEQPVQYVNSQLVNDDNSTATDGNIRLLAIPSTYTGTDMTAGTNWQVRPGAAAVFPFTFPDINNGADLLNAVTNNLLEPVAPEVSSQDITILYNSSNSFDIGALNLNQQKRVWFISNTDQDQSFTVKPVTSFGKTVVINGALTTPNISGNVTVPAARRTVIWQTFTDQDAIGGVTYIETISNNESSSTSPLSRLVVSRTGNTGTWPNGGVAPIAVNAVDIIEGNRFSRNGNQITVTAGSRVRLTGPTGGFFGGAGSNRHYWAEAGQSARYEPTGSVAVDGYAISVQATGGNITQQQAILEFTPTVDTTLELYSATSNNTFQLGTTSGLITCEVIGVGEVVNPDLVSVQDNNRIIVSGIGPVGGASSTDIGTFTVPENGVYEANFLVSGYATTTVWNKTSQIRDAANGGGNLIYSLAHSYSRSGANIRSVTPFFGEMTLQAGVTYHYRLVHQNEFTDQSDPVQLILRKKQLTVVRPEDLTITNPNGTGQLIGNGDNTATFNNGGILYNQANVGGVGTTVGTVADIGFVLQPGDEIMLQLDIGLAKAIWTGNAITVSTRFQQGGGSAENTIRFSQAGTILQFQGNNTNGTRQWLKIVR